MRNAAQRETKIYQFFKRYLLLLFTLKSGTEITVFVRIFHVAQHI